MNLSLSPWDYLSHLSKDLHHYHLNDDKLIDGNKVCQPYSKYPCVEESPEVEREDLICNAFGCNTTFNSISELDAHQQARHTHVCATCHMILPSYHLLDRHILEVHDSFFQISAQKSPMSWTIPKLCSLPNWVQTSCLLLPQLCKLSILPGCWILFCSSEYACLLEFCPKLFQTPLQRKEHCIKKHKFPSDFRYDLQFRKLKRPKQSKHNDNKGSSPLLNNNQCQSNNDSSSQTALSEARLMNTEAMECANTEVPPPGNAPKLSFNRGTGTLVPKSICFGVGIPRAFITTRGKRGKHWHQKSHSSQYKIPPNQINLSEMNDVLEQMEM